MLAITQNIPTPYRIAFFNTLAEECENTGIKFHVVYCAKREWNRHWSITETAFRHEHTVLRGWHPRIKDATLHINPGIGRALKGLSPQTVIYGGAWHLPTSWLASLALPARTKRVLWSEGHASTVSYKNGFVAALRTSALRTFDAFAVPNKLSEQWINDHLKHPRPAFRLPNTVDENFYTKRSKNAKSAARDELGISNSTRLFVKVSQLEDRKGVCEFVESFARTAPRASNDATLALLGTGSLEAMIRSKYADMLKTSKLFLAGHVPPTTLRTWLRAADWFCLNSHNDPNPLSPIEASLTGVPLLLSSKAGNVFELLGNAETGIVIENQHAPDLELLAALDMPASRLEAIGENAFKNASHHFSRRKAALSLISQLQDAGFLHYSPKMATDSYAS